MDKEEWEKILEKASRDLRKSLEKFGPNEVLGLLAQHSHNDPVVLDLLSRFAMIISLAEFLGTLPIIKVDKRTFKRLKGRGCLV